MKEEGGSEDVVIISFSIISLFCCHTVSDTLPSQSHLLLRSGWSVFNFTVIM